MRKDKLFLQEILKWELRQFYVSVLLTIAYKIWDTVSGSYLRIMENRKTHKLCSMLSYGGNKKHSPYRGRLNSQWLTPE